MTLKESKCIKITFISHYVLHTVMRSKCNYIKLLSSQLLDNVFPCLVGEKQSTRETTWLFQQHRQLLFVKTASICMLGRTYQIPQSILTMRFYLHVTEWECTDKHWECVRHPGRISPRSLCTHGCDLSPR